MAGQFIPSRLASGIGPDASKDAPGTLICARCDRRLSPAAFAFSQGRSKDSYCRECRRQDWVKYNAARRQAIDWAAYQRAWRRRNRLSNAASCARWRARFPDRVREYESKRKRKGKEAS